MRVLLIFLDGVGLGADDIIHNPFRTATLPTLHSLTNGQRWLDSTGIQRTDRALFIPTDATMGVAGRPQSGTGQAAIITGENVPERIGEHYGPKPNEKTRAILHESNLFSDVINAGKTAAILEAYPPGWHHVIESGRRLPASYQMAAKVAGLRFFGEADLRSGRALSGDWTGAGWQTELGYDDMPTLSAYDAGVRLAALAGDYDFAFFPHWITDVTGHRGDLAQAIKLLETFDDVMRGVLDTWDDAEGVVIVTSDHGNIEDLSHRNHTKNSVPTVIIGAKREQFSGVHDLTHIAPVIRNLLLSVPGAE